MEDKDSKDHFYINLEDEVVRGSILLENGKLLWPPPPPKVIPAQATKAAEVAKKAEPPARNYFQETLNSSLVYTGGLSGLVGLGVVAPNTAFTTMTTTFALSGIVGYHVVWGVQPALHSPLMSVTNAISGITAVGT